MKTILLILLTTTLFSTISLSQNNEYIAENSHINIEGKVTAKSGNLQDIKLQLIENDDLTKNIPKW